MLVDDIQAQYKQLASLSTPANIANDPTRQYRNIQGYLARGDLRFVGETQSTIAERPTIREGSLVLRRQPLTYLEASEAPELLRYLELYLTLHSELQGRTWADARQHIQVPSTLETIHEFMLAVEAIEIQKGQIQATIQTLLLQVEELVEATYNEPADSSKMEIIHKLREKSRGAQLF